MPRLSSLGLAALSPQVLSFFLDLGIVSVEDFLVHDMYSLVALVGYQHEPNQYKQAVADILLFLEENHAVWWDGIDLFSMIQQTISIIPVGCDSLDSLLQGGLREGTVTELFGASSSGKTQVCIQAAANVICLGGSVAYIDTCNSFSALRLSEVLHGLMSSKTYKGPGSLEQALKSITCYRVYDVFSLLELLHQLDVTFSTYAEGRGEMTPALENLRLLVLDSVTSVVAPVLNNTQVQGHALMMKCGQTLRKIASDNNLCVLVTNHMVVGENALLKPALGESWKAVAHVRLFLSKNPATDTCCASLVKHSSTSCNKQSFFRVETAGVQSLDAIKQQGAAADG